MSKAAEPLSVLAQEEAAPRSLAVDERYLYWATRDALRRMPRDGGRVTTLVQGVSAQRVVASAGYVFFSDSLAGTVTRVDRAQGLTLVIGRGLYPNGIAQRAGRVFWANGGMTSGLSGADGSIASVALDGSDARTLVSGLSQPASVAVDAENLYFTSTSAACTAPTPGGSGSSGCAGGGVSRVGLTGGTPQLLGARETVSDVALGQRGAYWIIDYPTRVLFAPFGAAGPETFANLRDVTPGPFVVVDEVLYMAAPEAGRVIRLALDGGGPAEIAVDLGQLGGIAADGDWVYVTQPAQGRILRIAKDGSAARPTAPVTGPCPPPLGAAEEIASTPRADSNLELLALSLDSERVVASQQTYARVVADVGAIRAREPALADIGYFARSDGRNLRLQTSDMALQSIAADQYSAWDCLNTHYGLQQRLVERLFGTGYVTLTLKGLYNLELLAPLYRQLPGIVTAESNSFGGEDSTICALRTGPEIEYVFDRGSGDCPAGCIDHLAKRFVSTSAGVIELRETWDSQAGAPRPEWYTRACSRR